MTIFIKFLLKYHFLAILLFCDYNKKVHIFVKKFFEWRKFKFLQKFYKNLTKIVTKFFCENFLFCEKNFHV